jgi:hypothetical protein
LRSEIVRWDGNVDVVGAEVLACDGDWEMGMIEVGGGWEEVVDSVTVEERGEVSILVIVEWFFLVGDVDRWKWCRFDEWEENLGIAEFVL